jgi:hypothetical protein
MQSSGDLARSSMGQGEEDDIMISKHLLGGLFDRPIDERYQVWMVLAEVRSSTGTCSQRTDVDMRMRKQYAEQLSACITRGPRHRDPYCHQHEYAIPDKFMHPDVSSPDAIGG